MEFKKVFSICLLLCILGVFFGLFRAKQRYIFDWDQESDAINVGEMIQEMKPRLIGPRVSNENGFFAGPYHYYYLMPFYLLFGGEPKAGLAAVIFSNIMTAIAGYLVISNLYSQKAGIILGVILATTTKIICWSAMHLMGLGLIIFYISVKLLRGKKDWLLPISFFWGLATAVHLAPASLVIPITAAVILSGRKYRIEEYFKAAGLFCLPFLPILLFDFRHDFLNARRLVSFSNGNDNGLLTEKWHFLRTWWRSLNIFEIPDNLSAIILIEKIGMLIAAGWWIVSTKGKEKWFLIVWLLAPVIILSRYKGAISEYYYAISNILILIGLSMALARLEIKYILFAVAILAGYRSYMSIRTVPLINYEDKREIVEYLSKQQRDPIFNVSYNLGIGLDTGFRYIFKYYKREPQNRPEGHLYTVVFVPTGEKGELVFQGRRLGLVRK